MLPSNYAEAFWEEIWGCVNYIKIPYDTVMTMPVNERKIWIERHNLEQEIIKTGRDRRNGDGSHEMAGDSINGYAAITQEKMSNGTNF